MRLRKLLVAQLLLLAGCDRGVDFSKSGTMEEVAKQGLEIEEMKAEIRRLKQDQEFAQKQNIEMFEAIGNDFDDLQNQVEKNAKVQNANEKVDDDRWNAIRQRLGL